MAALNYGHLIFESSGDTSREEWRSDDSPYFSELINVLYGDTGEFLNHRGFVGLEFEAADGTHYGWLDLEGVREGGSTIRIHGWAYETEPGKGIVAGAIPEPSTLALLLAGGVGIWMVRKKRFHRKSQPHSCQSPPAG